MTEDPNSPEHLQRLLEELAELQLERERVERAAEGIPTSQLAVKRALRDRDARTSQRVEDLRVRISDEFTRTRDAVAAVEHIANNYRSLRGSRPLLPMLVGQPLMEEFTATISEIQGRLDEAGIAHDVGGL